MQVIRFSTITLTSYILSSLSSEGRGYWPLGSWKSFFASDEVSERRQSAMITRHRPGTSSTRFCAAGTLGALLVPANSLSVGFD